MKKMLAILLALLMMLSGMATAEETTDNNTNISHMLELCQRVDILLHSDRIVADLVGDTDAAITEEQKIVNRLARGKPHDAIRRLLCHGRNAAGRLHRR